MLLSTLVATASVALVQAPSAPINCPVTLQPAVKGMALTDYNGVRFTYCCPGCDAQFVKDPQSALDKAAKTGKTIGVFLFDPITRKPVDAEKAKGGSSDYKGVRFYFDEPSEKAVFDKEPAKFATLPKKEALYCPVSKEDVAGYSKASGYGDFEGTRYYFCCAGCDKPFDKEPAKYAPAAAGKVQVPKAQAAPAPATKNGGK